MSWCGQNRYHDKRAENEDSNTGCVPINSLNHSSKQAAQFVVVSYRILLGVSLLLVLLINNCIPLAAAFNLGISTRSPTLSPKSSCPARWSHCRPVPEPSGISIRKRIKLAGWYPKTVTYDDDIYSDEDVSSEVEDQVVRLVADLIRNRLRRTTVNPAQDDVSSNNEVNGRSLPGAVGHRIKELVKGRFVDLTCTLEGEMVLERLFYEDEVVLSELWDRAKATARVTSVSAEDVIRGAVMILQSLCVMGTQVGVKGLPEQLRRRVEHLADDRTNKGELDWRRDVWDNECVRRLKYRLDREPALQLLAALQWRRTPQGAYDLLTALGAWEKHEDLALLRSGFPIRFTQIEEAAAAAAVTKAQTGVPSADDPDSILGLRQDLRHLKVYTIDGASTSEIDDGVSIEVTHGRGNETGYRIWVHVADAERWAPPGSDLFEAARRRITSLYLPLGSISMFPSIVGSELMSLNSNQDVFALSMGVELNGDGSIDESSLVVTPSTIRVSYRLTYDEVDEMLEEGVGYNEEWELGALLAMATKRREFRIRNGSTEGVIPNPIPYSEISVIPDVEAEDSVKVMLSVAVSHNSARNRTAGADNPGGRNKLTVLEEPLSTAYLLVTEAMILAGEALGRWKDVVEDSDDKASANGLRFGNALRLPFRTQRQPDFKGRSRERVVMMDLLEHQVGRGLCHAWYARRFLESVSVTETRMPHAGLGLDAYVQWSSPIRRFSDLQVHASVKRFLRRRKVSEMLQNGHSIPPEISAFDLGISPDVLRHGVLQKESIAVADLDNDLNFMEGVGLIGVGKKLQRQSQQYWLFEYIRRLSIESPETTFWVIVLGCVDPAKNQFAIFVPELGLEHRFTSPGGRIEPGAEILVKVDKVSPRSGILSFVAVV